jgi:hypothetical protein
MPRCIHSRNRVAFLIARFAASPRWIAITGASTSGAIDVRLASQSLSEKETVAPPQVRVKCASGIKRLSQLGAFTVEASATKSEATYCVDMTASYHPPHAGDRCTDPAPLACWGTRHSRDLFYAGLLIDGSRMRISARTLGLRSPAI